MGTTKGEETRRRVYEAAVARFRADGYADASMRRIAGDAGVTPGLVYRYFASKEAIVAELYGKHLRAWEDRAASMPEGSWAERTLWLTRLAFGVLEEDRELLRALAPSMLEGDPTASPLKNDQSRAVAQPAFRRAIAGASDAPRKRDTETYAELAYMGHLALILFWVMDQSPGLRATDEVLEESAKLAPLLKLGLKMPVVGKSLLRVGRALSGGLRGERVA